VAPLVGGYVQVSDEERFPLPRNTYYHSDLVGCRIEEEGEPLGVVTGIFEVGGSVVNLVVATIQGGEAMIPMVKQFIKKVDIENKLIRVKTVPAYLSEGNTGAPDGAAIQSRARSEASSASGVSGPTTALVTGVDRLLRDRPEPVAARAAL